MHAKPLAAAALAAAVAIPAQASTIALTPTQDTFGRADAPDLTYGGAGGLSVSGPSATNAAGEANGVFATWLMFDAADAVGQFDAAYGAGNWTLAAATLTVREVGSPNNAIFNRGIGDFEVRYMASDDWSEGPGGTSSPGTATGNQIGYDYGISILGAGDEALGTFTSTGASGFLDLGLATTAGFAGDVTTGGLVSLHLSHVDDAVGFTFNSIGTPFAPQLTLEAVAIPAPPAAALIIIASLRPRRRRRERSAA